MRCLEPFQADEEFQIEKGRLVNQQRVKIIDFFTKKEKQLEQQKRLQQSKFINAGRLVSFILKVYKNIALMQAQDLIYTINLDRILISFQRLIFRGLKFLT